MRNEENPNCTPFEIIPYEYPFGEPDFFSVQGFDLVLNPGILDIGEYLFYLQYNIENRQFNRRVQVFVLGREVTEEMELMDSTKLLHLAEDDFYEQI